MGKAEQRCVQAPSVAILRHDKLSRIICRGEHRSPVLRICCKFRIVGENFLLPNLVVAVGLLLRRANTVRPCSGFAVNSELSGRIFCCRTLLWFCQYHLTHFIRTRIMQRERYDHSRAFFELPEAAHRWRCRFFC